MSSYNGRHAELYDIFYSDKEYHAESNFIHRCLQEYSESQPINIIELACGTGSHAFELEKQGYQIVAIDNSKDMLECATRKAQLRSSKIVFKNQDMRNFRIPDKKFDAVICLFDSIGYVLTNSAIELVFQQVYSHLKTNALFIFEFWHAGAMLKNFDPVRIKRYKTDDTEIIRISETNLNYSKDVAKVKYTILELNRFGCFLKFEEIHQNRYFSIPEMEILLNNQHFEPVKFFVGYSEDEKITADSWHIIAVARRK